jgi:hypothetical protein
MAIGLRTAINRKCRECIYDPRGGGGTWREQVQACIAPDCPLYPVRPRVHRSQPGTATPQQLAALAKAAAMRGKVAVPGKSQ